MFNFRTVLSAASLFALTACAGPDIGDQTSNAVDWDDPSAGPEGRWPGQTNFESAARWSQIWQPFMRNLADGTGLEAGQAQRTVEEGDIVKTDDNRAFVLNPYRGLMTLNISNVDNPVVQGRLKLQGSPQEMYVKGDIAFVLMNGLYSWNAQQDYRSSLVTVDVSNMAAPKVISEHRVDGRIVESRIVGDAIYIVSDEWQGAYQQSTTHVFSLNIASPANVSEVERVSFEGNGHQIHVTPEYLFVAKYNYPGTDIQVVDIRNPQGYLYVGNNVEIPGYVQDRFMMDYSDGHLRVVSHKWDQGGHILVDTFELDAAQTKLSPVGHLDLDDIGRLTAARFDGTRVYLVHMVQVDPLDVVDLANPASPELLDRIEIPGWLERLEVDNGRLVGIGFDQAGTPAPQKLCPGYNYVPLAEGRKLSVALYDVSDTGDVCEADRVRFGSGKWQWSNGFNDDKALKYIADENLLLVPFSEYQDNDYTRGVQLVDVDIDALELEVRGIVTNASQVERSFLTQTRLMALGNRELTVANIDNRDFPVVTANLELARNVVDFKAVGNSGYGVQLVGDYNEPAELRIVDLANADADRDSTLGRISIGKPAGDMYVDGSIVTVFSREYTEDGPKVTLSNFDVSSPFKPQKLGTLEFPIGYGHDIRPFMFRRYQQTSDIVRVQDDLFVVSAPEEEGMRYSLISNDDPLNPYISYEHHKQNDHATVLDLKAWWGDLYVVSTTKVQDDTAPINEGGDVIALDRGENDDLALNVMRIPQFDARRDRVKYWVTRVTFDQDGQPSIGSAVNVPGRLVDVSKDGSILTLVDARWENSEQQSRQKKELFTVEAKWNEGKAPLLDGLPLEQGVEDVKVRGKAAYYTEMWSSWSGPILPLADAVEAGQELVAPEPPQSALKLVVLNYGNPAKISEASRTTISEDGSNGSLQEVRKVDGNRFAFVSLGWGGLSVMNVTKPASPVIHEFVRSMAYQTKLHISPESGAAFMAGGYYGVETISLTSQKQ